MDHDTAEAMKTGAFHDSSDEPGNGDVARQGGSVYPTCCEKAATGRVQYRGLLSVG